MSASDRNFGHVDKSRAFLAIFSLLSHSRCQQTCDDVIYRKHASCMTSRFVVRTQNTKQAQAPHTYIYTHKHTYTYNRNERRFGRRDGGHGELERCGRVITCGISRLMRGTRVRQVSRA
jgi:hypothetical protein